MDKLENTLELDDVDGGMLAVLARFQRGDIDTTTMEQYVGYLSRNGLLTDWYKEAYITTLKEINEYGTQK